LSDTVTPEAPPEPRTADSENMAFNPQGYNPAAQPTYPPPAGAPYGAGGYGQATAPPPMGGFPPQAGYAPPQAGYAPQQAGYAPPQAGYAPPQAGYAPQAAYANQPPPGVSNDLWAWFQAVDADRSGRINANELKAALVNGNYSSFNDGTCRLMIKLFDRDNSGTIDVHEFSSLWKYISDWRDCFNRFDQDRSGSINSSELAQALGSFGYRLSPRFCQTLVKTYSSRKVGANSSNGSISFDDFIEACVTIKNLTDTFRAYDQHQQGVITVGFEQFLDMVVRGAVF
jgi:Ca2+-binding EF-hand superfamily protein